MYKGDVYLKYDFTIVDTLNLTLINSPKCTLPNIKLRYVLRIPYKNVEEGLSITVVMMNPSKASLTESDQSVNKLINFFSNFRFKKTN